MQFVSVAWIGMVSLFSSLLYSFTTPLLLMSYWVGIRYYIIRKDNDKTRAVVKTLQNDALNTITLFQCGSVYPSGCFVNWSCCGYYEYSDAYDGVSVEIHIITSSAYFNTLTATDKIPILFDAPATDITVPPTPLVIYARSGTYTGIYYSRIRTDIYCLEPRGEQCDIVDDICQIFARKRRGVFFLYGNCGTGKSTVGLIVANRLKGVFCHTFNPSEPGDTLPLLIRETDPSSERPTVILLEEVNIMIRALHDNTISKHKNITTCIHNKSTYNTFIDDLVLYKNVIIIMTSNESRTTIDALDPCYLRKGRVEKHYTLTEQLTA